MVSRSMAISASAFATALVYVMTCIAVPMPKPLGVWHAGDIASFISSILFGPIVGGFACGVGAALFDIWNPLYQSSFIIWAPATLIIRGIMGFMLGKLRRIIPSRPRLSEVLAMIISHVWKNFAYFAYDYYLFGPVAYLDLLTFFPLSAIDIAITVPLLAVIRKSIGKEYFM
ncbi:MAG: ECF transporter S component [archaeon GBS-70-058]|nr:ECF transporter S component [Candidatus Culexarchaeum nevadense]